MAEKTSFSKLLERYPAAAFSVSASVCMLGLVIKEFSYVFNWPGALSNVFSVLASVIVVVTLLLYALKYFKYPLLTAAEFDSPRGLCFFSFMTISLLLLSIIFKDLVPVSALLFVLGAVIQTVFMFYTAAYWLEKPDFAYESGGEKFIPAAGVLLIPIAGLDFVYKGYFPEDILIFYLAAGIFLWFMILAFLTVGFYAGKFKNKDTASFAGSAVLFPSFACLSLMNSCSYFANVLLWAALFFLILNLVIMRNFKQGKFHVSFWAYVFPALAFVYACLEFYIVFHRPLYLWFSLAVSFLACMWIVLAVISALKATRREISL